MSDASDKELQATYDALKYPTPQVGETWYVKKLCETTDTSLYALCIKKITKNIVQFVGGPVYKLSDVEFVEEVKDQ